MTILKWNVTYLSWYDKDHWLHQYPETDKIYCRYLEFNLNKNAQVCTRIKTENVFKYAAEKINIFWLLLFSQQKTQQELKCFSCQSCLQINEIVLAASVLSHLHFFDISTRSSAPRIEWDQKIQTNKSLFCRKPNFQLISAKKKKSQTIL